LRIVALPIAGVFIIEAEVHEDRRGIFARVFEQAAFRERGLLSSFDYCSTSYNERALTLRGLHFQAEPFAEAKLVRCTRGAIFDVAVDLRPASPTYGTWHGRELSADNRLSFHIPKGCAHGFLTLVDGAEVSYMICGTFEPQAARRIRWDDPTLAISWPASSGLTMSDADAAAPSLRDWEKGERPG
jgi:dTDP-4-dehydrorhamnose 3,5-epimerase